MKIHISLPGTSLLLRIILSFLCIDNFIYYFRGLAGAIFVTLVVATLLYVIGFATNAWMVYDATHEGLWQKCVCDDSMKKDGKHIVM